MSRKERKENEVAVERTQGAVADLQARVRALSEEYEDYQFILRDYDGFIKKQNEVVAEQESAMRAGMVQLDQYRENLTIAKQQHEALEKQHVQYLAPFQSQLDATKPAADQAAAILNNANTALENAKAEHSKAEDLLRQCNANLDSLEREAANIQNDPNVQLDYAAFNINLTRVQNALNMAQNHVYNTAQNVDERQAQFNRAQAQYDTYYAPYKKASDQLEQAKKKCEAEAEASMQTIRDIESSMDDAQNAINAAAKAADAAKKKIATAPEVRDDPSRVAVKEGELQAMAGQLESESQKLSELHARGEELKAERKRWWKIVIIVAVVLLVLSQVFSCLAH